MKHLLHVNSSKLLDLPKDRRDDIILKEKIELLKFISICTKRNITKIKAIFLNLTLNFGNQLAFSSEL